MSVRAYLGGLIHQHAMSLHVFKRVSMVDHVSAQTPAHARMDGLIPTAQHRFAVRLAVMVATAQDLTHAHAQSIGKAMTAASLFVSKHASMVVTAFYRIHAVAHKSGLVMTVRFQYALKVSCLLTRGMAWGEHLRQDPGKCMSRVSIM
jgi:urocanate hydratase